MSPHDALFTRGQRVRLRPWVKRRHLRMVHINFVVFSRFIVLEPVCESPHNYNGPIVKVREVGDGNTWWLKRCFLEADQ